MEQCLILLYPEESLSLFPWEPGRVIKGWDEGIAMLKEGGVKLLYTFHIT